MRKGNPKLHLATREASHKNDHAMAEFQGIARSLQLRTSNEPIDQSHDVNIAQSQDLGRSYNKTLHRDSGGVV